MRLAVRAARSERRSAGLPSIFSMGEDLFTATIPRP